MPRFDRLRQRQHDEAVFLYAFDLIELTGDFFAAGRVENALYPFGDRTTAAHT